MLLGVIYRTSMQSYEHVAGLSEIKDVPGIENYNLSDIVNGHMEYQSKLPKILKRIGFEVNSETFEDQDTELANFKAEKEAEKQKLKEMREAEKTEGQKQREAEKLKLQQLKEAELEKKRLANEMAASEKKRLAEAAKPSTNVAMNIHLEDDLAAEELRQMGEMESIMSDYWKPREITSTLPPLIIDSIDPVKPIDTTEQPAQCTEEDEGELSDF